MDLSELTVEDFSSRLGSEFRVRIGEEVSEILELVSAETTSNTGELGRTDTAFSVLFRGSSDQILPQNTFEFEHDEMGLIPLFVVPISQDEKGTLYEAVFTRLDTTA